MTREEAQAVIMNEQKCVDRANRCDRNCAECDLVMEDSVINNAYSMAIKALNGWSQWIPVEDRLPEKPGKYLVTVQNWNVYAGTFDMVSHKFQCAATAWMELPEPYRRDES